jgi:hypothetical protein
VYDTSRNRTYNNIFINIPKILEVRCNTLGQAGHPQRNFGLTLVEDGHIYFLDDDNIIHPEFWKIINLLDSNKFYTFDQIRDKNGNILRGDSIKVNSIDTAMLIVHKKHIKNTKWIEDKYNADGYFICDIYNNNTNSHIYINSTYCYYNFLV